MKEHLHIESEFETSYHLLILGVFTLMGMLLNVITIIADWNILAVPIVTAILIICWGMHFFKIATPLTRLYIYVILILCCLLFYGYHNRTLTDIPILLCLMIVLISEQKDMRLIYLVALFYVPIILENIFLTHNLTLDSGQLEYSRFALGIVCLIAAVFVSRFFILKNIKMQKMVADIQHDLDVALGENEQFLSNISHELRTPINAVNGMSEIILHKDLDSQTASEVRVIQDAGKRLYRQVSDIIDFSELQTGHFLIQNENYEPLSALNDAVSTVFGKEIRKKLEFAIDMEVSVPKLLYGDVTKLKKLLVCILDNAVKFTDKGGGYLYISKREEEYGINLNIDVWDTGIGMTSDEISHLYDGTAYQKDTTMERHVGGMGLGMSIAQGIVAAMHGFLTVESKEGEGTHVHISIPQQVKNVANSISIEYASDYRVVCYFNKEKYVRPEIAKYYYSMIRHIRENLKMDIYATASLQELKDIVIQRKFTHMFVSDWEYNMDAQYFCDMSRQMHVAVFTDVAFPVPAEYQIEMLVKPVYVLSTINYLKRTMAEDRNLVMEKKERKAAVHKKTALVVDDDDMNLVVARGILKNFGLVVETAKSGDESIELCMDKNYDIIFMDYMMPMMNGTDAMRRIRQLRDGYYQKIPVVVLTANAISGARAEFLKDGFDEFISKPIEIAVMKKVLRKFLVGENEVL